MSTIKYETATRGAFLRAAVAVAESRKATNWGMQGAESVLKAADRNAGFSRVGATTKDAFTEADWVRFGYPRSYASMQ